MISGFSSSGIATAIRTASKARATMDTMARQIATGQRVASVKDDGAAWARAANVKSQITTHEVNAQRLSLYDAHFKAAAAVGAQEEEISARIVDVLDRANGYAAATQARTTLHTELQGILNSVPAGIGTAIIGILQEHMPVGPSAGLLGAVGANGRNLGNFQTSILAIVGSLNLQTATQTQVATARAAMNSHLEALRLTSASDGTSHKVVEQIGTVNARAQGVAETHLGALTDADLAKSSAARAQAETRQQLALATVRQAIGNYANFAGGLLGNVQRTQRGGMA